MTTNADPLSTSFLSGLSEEPSDWRHPESLDDFTTRHDERQALTKTPTIWALTRAYFRALHEVYRKASSARRRKAAPSPAAASRGRTR